MLLSIAVVPMMQTPGLRFAVLKRGESLQLQAIRAEGRRRRGTAERDFLRLRLSGRLRVGVGNRLERRFQLTHRWLLKEEGSRHERQDECLSDEQQAAHVCKQTTNSCI